MTNEEAKMQIQAIPGKIWDQLSEPDREAMEMAFSALEKQIPMNDVQISRAAAKLKVARVIWEDGDSCDDFHDKCVDCLDDVPPAQPELEPKREKGHWQISDAYPHNVYCSECHARFAQTHWAVWEDGSLPRRFCPSCGKEMELTEP